MKIILVLVAIVAAFIACVAVAFVAYGRERSWTLIAGEPDRGRLNLATLERSPTANDAFACTDSIRDGCEITLPAFDEEPAELIEKLAKRIEARDPLARRVDNGEHPGHLRYVTYSPTMRFPDLVNIEAVEMDDGRTGVIAYARAQLGKLDFGANRARLQSYFEGS